MLKSYRASWMIHTFGTVYWSEHISPAHVKTMWKKREWEVVLEMVLDTLSNLLKNEHRGVGCNVSLVYESFMLTTIVHPSHFISHQDDATGLQDISLRWTCLWGGGGGGGLLTGGRAPPSSIQCVLWCVCMCVSLRVCFEGILCSRCRS